VPLWWLGVWIRSNKHYARKEGSVGSCRSSGYRYLHRKGGGNEGKLIRCLGWFDVPRQASARQLGINSGVLAAP
jgi:hypothetical protein